RTSASIHLVAHILRAVQASLVVTEHHTVDAASALDTLIGILLIHASKLRRERVVVHRPSHALLPEAYALIVEVTKLPGSAIEHSRTGVDGGVERIKSL